MRFLLGSICCFVVAISAQAQDRAGVPRANAQGANPQGANVQAAQDQERYFVTFYASQRSGREPQATHSFAVFVRASVGDKGADPARAESFTISWMPASGAIRLLAPPEPGKNYTLRETLDWAEGLRLRTRSWGPFEITREIYDRAVEQRNRLESGAVAYKALDRRFRTGNATNCIHAISDVIPGSLLGTGSAAGEAATALVVSHYRPHFVESERTHPWVLQAAGLPGESGVLNTE